MRDTREYQDTLFSHGKLYLWEVTNSQGLMTYLVWADSADHACDYMCRSMWFSRLHLSARPAQAEDRKEA